MAQASLTVWQFGTPGGAAEASSTLRDLVTRDLITVHGAAAVSWEQGAKKPTTTPLTALAGAGALNGSFWGMLFGLIFFVPLLGAALGMVSGAVAGVLTDAGIDDSFINQVRDQVTPGTSALFVMSSGAVLDTVRDAFEGQGPDELIVTDLTGEQEEALREVFAA